jgi:hypothetical protein
MLAIRLTQAPVMEAGTAETKGLGSRERGDAGGGGRRDHGY